MRSATLADWPAKRPFWLSGGEGMEFASGVNERLRLELSALGFPARLEGEYRHSIPQVRQREQIGLALEHLTLARKHPSHDARRRGCRGFEVLAILALTSG